MPSMSNHGPLYYQGGSTGVHGLTYMFNFWHSVTLAFSPERQSARMLDRLLSAAFTINASWRQPITWQLQAPRDHLPTAEFLWDF